MRELIITANGASDSLLVPNGDEQYWLAIVTANSWGSMTASLEASVDNSTWFPSTDSSGAVVFSGSSAVLASAGLYYRVVVANYASDVTFTIKPN